MDHRGNNNITMSSEANAKSAAATAKTAVASATEANIEEKVETLMRIRSKYNVYHRPISAENSANQKLSNRLQARNGLGQGCGAMRLVSMKYHVDDNSSRCVGGEHDIMNWKTTEGAAANVEVEKKVATEKKRVSLDDTNVTLPEKMAAFGTISTTSRSVSHQIGDFISTSSFLKKEY